MQAPNDSAGDVALDITQVRRLREIVATMENPDPDKTSVAASRALFQAAADIRKAAPQIF